MYSTKLKVIAKSVCLCNLNHWMSMLIYERKDKFHNSNKSNCRGWKDIATCVKRIVECCPHCSLLISCVNRYYINNFSFKGTHWMTDIKHLFVFWVVNQVKMEFLHNKSNHLYYSNYTLKAHFLLSSYLLYNYLEKYVCY